MSRPRHLLRCLAVASLCCGAVVAHAQPAAPTHKDVAYDDDHASQKLDVYLAGEKKLPAMVYIHGGGWRAGSKDRIPAWLAAGVSQGQFHVISVEYRFTDVATHPAQVNDCIRAIQFVRQQADKWHVDPARIGVTGGSAGGHLSLWVALHDDAAKADASDPVERQSSRVRCAVSFAGPTDWSLLATLDHRHPAYRQLIGYAPGTPADQLDEAKKQDVSPISFASKDDPPIMQVHGDKDDIVPIQHAQRMDAQLRKLEVTSELVVVPGANHGVAGAANNVSGQATKFVERNLLAP
ncbi:MAG: alpha/beta hydrolase fold domain-containing protein [Planctomycetales bacterium]|nr:alpha/beta hydrolase fold domain-containing protein [Planctomycetales bacterium]